MSKAVFFTCLLVLLATAGTAQIPEVTKCLAVDIFLTPTSGEELFGNDESETESCCSSSTRCEDYHGQECPPWDDYTRDCTWWDGTGSYCECIDKTWQCPAFG